MFIKTNKNPLGKHVNDCIIRAISVTENQSWEDVFIVLSKIAMVEACLPNHEDAYGKFLKDHGYTCKNAKMEYNGGEPKLWKFVEDHPGITAIMDVEGHAVPIINGDYFDTADHGYKSTYLYWQKD